LPLNYQISDVDRTRDESSKHAKAEIGLIAGLDGSDRRRAVGRGRLQNGRQHGPDGFRAFASCLHPAMANVEAMAPATTKNRVLMIDLQQCHGLARAQQLATVDDDAVSSLQPFLDQHGSGFVSADSYRLQNTVFVLGSMIQTAGLEPVAVRAVHGTVISVVGFVPAVPAMALPSVIAAGGF
jgi:hypothetical protein